MRIPSRSLLASLALLFGGACALAQTVGVGAGIAIPSDEIAQLPQSVRDDGWREIESRASRGYFIEVRARTGIGTSLTGAISYNRFLDAASDFSDGSGRTVSLITSQVVVPASIGLEHAFGVGVIVTYATLEGTLNYFYRAYESPHDGTPVPFRIESSGEALYGAALGVGSALDLGIVRFDAFVRVQVVNLFGGASTDESTMYFLQAGLSGYFGL